MFSGRRISFALERAYAVIAIPYTELSTTRRASLLFTYYLRKKRYTIYRAHARALLKLAMECIGQQSRGNLDAVARRCVRLIAIT